MPADGSQECEGSSIERPETKSKRRKEKRILVKESVPTIQCANTSPVVQLEASDCD